jgi:hypothetical protein
MHHRQMADVTMTELVVTRLLQNPLGQPALDGERGDIVRVSDDQVAVYFTPWEYEQATEDNLRWRLARRAAGYDRD